MPDFVIKAIAQTAGVHIAGATRSAIAGAAISLAFAEVEFVNLSNNLFEVKTTSADVITLATVIGGISLADSFTSYQKAIMSGTEGGVVSSARGGRVISPSPTEQAQLTALQAKQLYHENILGFLERFRCALNYISLVDGSGITLAFSPIGTANDFQLRHVA